MQWCSALGQLNGDPLTNGISHLVSGEELDGELGLAPEARGRDAILTVSLQLFDLEDLTKTLFH